MRGTGLGVHTMTNEENDGEDGGLIFTWLFRVHDWIGKHQAFLAHIYCSVMIPPTDYALGTSTSTTTIIFFPANFQSRL